MSQRQNKKTKQKRAGSRVARSGDEIKIGNISGGTGFAIGPGAQAYVSQTTGAAADEIAKAFKALQQEVNSMPDGAERNVAESALKSLETEARKGEAASESQVQRWMNFLADTAPDAWEVAVDVFTNPIKGVSTIFRKIAEKARAERNASQSKNAKT
jgi:hypothetical protein